MHLELMRDERREFPEVAKPEVIVTARVWHCKYRSLAPLARLVTLEGAAIASFPDPTFELIAGLQHLRHLAVVHLPKVTDLAPIASLSSLEVLSLATLPSWDASGKRTLVRTLRPLAALPRLRHLELLGVIPADDSTTCLRGHSTLETVRLHGFSRGAVSDLLQTGKVRDAPAPEPWF